jgi:hypothetical protein
MKLQNVRLSFPALFRAEAFKQGDEPKFKATFLIPKGSDLHEQVEKAILDVVRAKHGAKAEKIIAQIRNNPNKFCYQDGDTKSYDGYEGMMALSAKNSVRPTVIDRNKAPLTEQDGKPYAGCYVNATVDFFAYDNSGVGVSASVTGVQFLRGGDAFAGGRAASPDDFDEIDEGADADDLV